MTFKEIQDAVMERLNVTTAEARARIKREINLRNAEVTSGVGLGKARRVTVPVMTTAMNASLTIANVANVFSIFDPMHLHTPLDEVSTHELNERDADVTDSGHPRVYAIVTHLKDSVTVRLYPKPSGAYELKVDAMALGVNLVADDDEPLFPEDFHDVLVFGALYDEMLKIEKQRGYVQAVQTDYEKRKSELRYFLAKRAYFSRKQNDRLGEFGISERRWGPIGVL